LIIYQCLATTERNSPVLRYVTYLRTTDVTLSSPLRMHALTNSHQQPDTETDNFLSNIKSTINGDYFLIVRLIVIKNFNHCTAL